MLSASLRRASSNASEVSCSRTLARHASSSAVEKRPPNEALEEVGKLLRNRSAPKADSGDVNRIKNTTRHLLNGIQQGDNPKWRHTYGKKSHAEKLKQALVGKTGKQRQIAVEEHAIEDLTIEDFLESTSANLQPGTYFEMRRTSEIITGIILGEIPNTVGHNTIGITPRGSIAYLRSSDVMFAIPNFIDIDLVNRCGLGMEHTDEHELAARLRVLQRMKEFERAVEKEQFRFGHAIREVYPRMRARDPNDWGRVTTMQVARMLESAPNVPIVTLYAVHKQLMDRSHEFVCHPNRHRIVHQFELRPHSQLENLKIIGAWAKDKNPVIRKFQEKAKTIINRSRKMHEDSWNEPAAVEAELTDLSFSKDEQTIIQFLKTSVINNGRKTQSDPFELYIPAILKDTYCCAELLTSFEVLKFLRDLGVWTPWEDIASKRRGVTVVDETSSLPITHTTASDASVKVATPGLLTHDAHETVRYDFGDMPVYVIDDPTAEELDDGISVEPVLNEPGSVWLHMHVADPTTVVPITHPLSKSIQKRSESAYFGHKSIPMLPPDIGKIADMGHSDVRTKGQNVLTFSAKIDSNGKIADYKVRVGRVRNVHKFSYDDVNQCLGIDINNLLKYPFEKDFIFQKKESDVSKILPHVDTIKLAFDATRRVVADRLKTDIFVLSGSRLEVTFLDKPVPESPLSPKHPVLYRGFPRLSYEVADSRIFELGSRSLVGECMKIAGRIASRFCTEHGIPCIRRTMSKPAFQNDEQLRRVLAARDQFGLVDPVILQKEAVMIKASDLSMNPDEHYMLGVPAGEGYSRTTSPLRRADDMIMHWQIKSALLPKTASPSARRPPISETMMRKVVEELASNAGIMKSARRAHVRQWTHEYIMRYMESQKRGLIPSYPDWNPLKNMEGLVLTEPTFNTARGEIYQDVMLPALGLRAILPLKNGLDDKFEIGTTLRLDAKGVFQYDLTHNIELALSE